MKKPIKPHLGTYTELRPPSLRRFRIIIEQIISGSSSSIGSI
jgi:hypothetical protein